VHSVECCELRSIGTELRKLRARAREREGQLSCGVFALHAVPHPSFKAAEAAAASQQRQAKPGKQALAHSVATAKAELKRRAKKKKGEEGGKSVVQLLQSLLSLQLTESISPTHHLKNICCLPLVSACC